MASTPSENLVAMPNKAAIHIQNSAGPPATTAVATPYNVAGADGSGKRGAQRAKTADLAAAPLLIFHHVFQRFGSRLI